MRYSARWQEHSCAGLSSFEVYTCHFWGVRPARAADAVVVLRLLFSSPKPARNTVMTDTVAVPFRSLGPGARSRSTRTAGPPFKHTLELFVRGSRGEFAADRPRWATTGLRGSCGPPAYGDVHCCLANMRIVAHFTGVNGSSRAGDACGISCHLTMNTIKRSSHLSGPMHAMCDIVDCCDMRGANANYLAVEFAEGL